MNWRIWYSSHSTTISTFEEWKQLPDGIEGVVEYEDTLTREGYPTRVLISGGDWYWWHEGRILTTRPNYNRGEWEDPPEGACSSCLKRSGIWLSDEDWERIRIEMAGARIWR